jgi:UDP-N-acetylglucosamine--N-acetylmuramyl-(pentapeptide) pyrophosphoryl-undecaprenol N-acetylglucosamine transferase
MVLAAALLRIPTALTEADAHLGLANRLASPFARRVYLAYPVEGRTGDRYEVVGRPIPARARPVAQVDARQLFGLPQHGQVVLVAGALAGATALNEFAVETFGTRGPAVLHITGERDFAAISARVSRPEYRVIATTDQIGAAYAAADLAITRAGSSVWEIAAAGTPAIFVPYPYATADHQAKNAQHFVRAGGALMVREAELATVPALARELLADETRLQAMHDAMLTAARPQAADVIAEGLIELARA